MISKMTFFSALRCWKVLNDFSMRFDQMINIKFFENKFSYTNVYQIYQQINKGGGGLSLIHKLQ